ncbi:hypothetical protein Tco_1105747 [Tanacetum coccineum]
MAEQDIPPPTITAMKIVGKIDCNRLNTGSITNSNSYLRDILGDILGKDMYYPLTFVKPIRVSLVYKRNPKAQCYICIRTLVLAPKQQQQVIPQTTAISNIKLPILKKEKYDIWAMEMENYLEYIDNEVWKEAIRTRFGGNANSKKMQKAVFKQQFEAFKISNSEGLEKGYDRFQQLLSQLEAHGAEVSTEDANHKFLRSLPPAWYNLAMTMRTNPEIDNLSIDDLYNNLSVTPPNWVAAE